MPDGAGCTGRRSGIAGCSFEQVGMGVRFVACEVVVNSGGSVLRLGFVGHSVTAWGMHSRSCIHRSFLSIELEGGGRCMTCSQ
jgi:hypothetical protein